MAAHDACRLETSQLCVSLAGRPVVQRVDMVVHPGELLALPGVNGSGKSTLVRACLGLIPHTSGSVRLIGQSLKDFRAWHRTGYVPQRAAATAGVPDRCRGGGLWSLRRARLGGVAHES